MSSTVHGHAVLNMILSASQPMTLDALREAVSREFGADARFHTCSADELTLDDLLAFLLARGKLTQTGDTLTAHREAMCAHE